MSTAFTSREAYDATPSQMWDMITDPSYTRSKYETLGAANLDITAFAVDGSTLTVSSVRDVAANIPAVGKKVIGDTATVTQTEKWVRTGDTLNCDAEVLVKGAPGEVKGTMTIEPDGGGCLWSADLRIRVPIPLIGKKLEAMSHAETTKNFADERAFNDQWLAGHRPSAG